MSEIIGRKVSISIGGSVVATARTKNLTINNEMINVTSDGDSGVQRFLNEMGEKSVEVSVDGLMADDSLLTKALSNDLSAALVLDYGTYTISGTFVMPSYTEGMAYNDAVTFSASFSSSGAVVKGV